MTASGGLVPESYDKHSIWQVGYLSVQGERNTGRGNFVSYSKVPGDITVVPAGPIPAVRLYTQAELISCSFDTTFIEGILAEMDYQPNGNPAFSLSFRDSATGRLLGLLIEELEAGAPSGTLYAESLAHTLAVRYLTVNRAMPQKLPPGISPLPPAILRKIKDQIEANLAQKLTLRILAAESGYSRSYFLRMFHAAIGATPHEYLVERRLNRAQHLLKLRRSSIAAIAEECGFSSQAHMTDLFRKKLGITPGQFRRNY